jgi:hypothetical protein
VKGGMTEENLCTSRIDLLNLIITGAALNEAFSKSIC